MNLFVDMDGVVADFDTGYRQMIGPYGGKEADNADWAAVANTPDFYLNLPPMPDFKELWTAISPLNPIILTGIPSSVPEARNNKVAWVRKNIDYNTIVVTCKSKDKCQYGKPGDILIDDWDRYKHLWVEMGGVWITHVSAAETIRQLVAVQQSNLG